MVVWWSEKKGLHYHFSLVILYFKQHCIYFFCSSYVLLAIPAAVQSFYHWMATQDSMGDVPPKETVCYCLLTLM